ncbi:MAG: DUF1697 domain-containing protein [Saprospiraceae bacterium]|nr:DUF1697 domain-containing protein [Saprospiraceae bacterium]
MRYISLLRGINVSGHNKIAMKDLKIMYENLGLRQVNTYIQSGNVLFDAHEGFEVSKIEQAITQHFNLQIKVFIFEVNDIAKALGQNPFWQSADAACLYYTFLDSVPNQELADKIERQKYLPDEWTIVEKVLFLHCPNGYGKTKLTNNFFEQKLKVNATTRNQKTLLTLLEMAQ